MSLLKEIFGFEGVLGGLLGFFLVGFIFYISPALIFSKLVMGKYPEKDKKLDVVISLIFSTGFWIVLYLFLLSA